MIKYFYVSSSVFENAILNAFSRDCFKKLSKYYLIIMSHSSKIQILLMPLFYDKNVVAMPSLVTFSIS